MAPAVSQQRRAQDLTLAQQCVTERITGHHGQEGGNGDANRNVGGDWNEDEYGKNHEGRDGGPNGSGDRDQNRDEGGGEREPGNVRSGNRGGSEGARRGATSTRNQQPQSQDPTPQRNRCIMRKTRAQRREARDRIGKGGNEAKKREKPQKSYRRNVENRETWAEGGENVDKGL